MTEPSVDGSWLKVADLMGCRPELAIFRKFRTLNTLKLIEMHSHLVQEESKFKHLCALAAQSKDPKTRSSLINWEAMDGIDTSDVILLRETWQNLRNEIDSYSMLQLLDTDVSANC